MGTSIRSLPACGAGRLPVGLRGLLESGRICRVRAGLHVGRLDEAWLVHQGPAAGSRSTVLVPGWCPGHYAASSFHRSFLARSVNSSHSSPHLVSGWPYRPRPEHRHAESGSRSTASVLPRRPRLRYVDIPYISVRESRAWLIRGSDVDRSTINGKHPTWVPGILCRFCESRHSGCPLPRNVRRRLYP
jgi:hypothetical protein